MAMSPEQIFAAAKRKASEPKQKSAKKQQEQRDARFGRLLREFIQGTNHATIDSFNIVFPTPTIESLQHVSPMRIRMLRNSDGTVTIESSTLES